MPRTMKKGYADVVDPTKQVSQEERIGRSGRKLEESDKQSLRLQVAQDEELLSASLKTASTDSAQIRSRLERNKMILAHDDDLTPKSGSEKDRLHARLKDITETLQKNMPTKREMWPKTGSAEAQQAVRHNVRFQEQYGPLCHEYQELKKRLEPDDPYAQSLELIRPD